MTPVLHHAVNRTYPVAGRAAAFACATARQAIHRRQQRSSPSRRAPQPPPLCWKRAGSAAGAAACRPLRACRPYCAAVTRISTKSCPARAATPMQARCGGLARSTH